MKLYKLFLPVIAWILCCSHMMTTVSTNRSRGIVAAEAAGLSFIGSGSSSIVSVGDFVKAAGLGYGAAWVLNELQNQQVWELDTLLSRCDSI